MKPGTRAAPAIVGAGVRETLKALALVLMRSHYWLDPHEWVC